MDKKLKSIEELAKVAGVAKSTVSRALNDSPLVNPETKAKILDIAEAYGFKPSAIARNLSLRSSKAIAFVTHAYEKKIFDCCSITDPFSLEIMGDIAIGLHELGYDLLIVHIAPDTTDWARQYLDSGRVDGFILMTSSHKREHTRELLKIGAPFVAWGEGEGDYSSVSGENEAGGRLATERLLSLGRRRIAFIGGPEDDSEVQGRFTGYQESLEAAGVDLDPRLVVYGDFSEHSGTLATEVLLKREPKLDAIFSNSDLMAMAAMRVLSAQGRSVPADVAVVGYDNLSLASYTTPRLTTVSQNIPLAGRLLARNLVARIEKGVITSSSVPVELIIRESA